MSSQIDTTEDTQNSEEDTENSEEDTQIEKLTKENKELRDKLFSVNYELKKVKDELRAIVTDTDTHHVMKYVNYEVLQDIFEELKEVSEKEMKNIKVEYERYAELSIENNRVLIYKSKQNTIEVPISEDNPTFKFSIRQTSEEIEPAYDLFDLKYKILRNKEDIWIISEDGKELYVKEHLDNLNAKTLNRWILNSKT